MGPTDGDLVVSTVLTKEVSATASGSPSGGFPVIFTSPSSQLGSDPAGIFVKFSDPKSSEVIYVLPTSDGDSKHTHLVLCAPMLNITTFNASAAPIIFGMGPEPYIFGSTVWASRYPGAVSAHETGKLCCSQQLWQCFRSSDECYKLHHAGASVESTPLNELARTNGAKIDEKCLLYSVQVAPWALAPGTLSVPAPPEAVFGVLTRAHEGVLDASGAARRLMSEAITGTLVVNGQEVMSVPVTYDASAGPQLLSVSPAMISAAMPEVRFVLTTAHWCLYLDAEVARLSWFHAVWGLVC
jgi:hypothetical protein